MAMAKEAQRASQRKLGSAMVRWGAAGLAVPDPLPIVDEVLFSAVVAVGAGLYVHASLPYGSVTSYPSQSAITSATGQTVRTPAKKQMRSTSRSSYSRRRYNYGKKRNYRY